MFLNRLRAFLRLFGSTGILFLLLASLLWGLKEGWSWVSLEMQFLGYKGSVAALGPDPRLPIVGTTFPPLLVMVTAILGRSPLLLQTILGSLLLGWMWRQLRRLPVEVGWRWLWGLLMVLQPALILMLLRSPAWTATSLLLGVNMALLFPLADEKRAAGKSVAAGDELPITLRLLLVGLALGPLMVLRWESGWLLPWAGMLLLVAFRREVWGFRWASLLVAGFVSLALILSWLYVNWLSVGDPWAFTYQVGSGLRLPQLREDLQQAGGWRGVLEAGKWLAVLAPAYLLLGLGSLLGRGPGRWVWALVWGMPLVILLASLGQGLFLRELSRFGLFWVPLPLLMGAYLCRGAGPGWAKRLLITALLGLNCLTAGYGVSQEPGFLMPLVAEERDLWERLVAGLVPLSGELEAAQNLYEVTSAGQALEDWRRLRQEKRQVGQYLYRHLLPGQKVLVDDDIHFEAIFWARDPRSFLTPHQYEFALALQHPQERVDYLLVAGLADPLRSADRILQFWPELNFEGLPGFREVYSSPQVRLWARQHQEEPQEERR
ncbi:hypothetical protein NW820_02710 [Synechococcus sp. R55.7]|uniref:hypothetical protein n=1 Tax=Synechococcus sp. R55.7 TaxID=2964500 RepID=UPI0039C24FF7